MEITGIIAEYNPFHNGHLYQIHQTQKILHSDAVVAIMSGNFSQRGSATITNKFIRTQMALQNGVDLVLELPFPIATASAERFAQGAVSLLEQSGIITSLSFGSECGSISELSTIAKALFYHADAIDIYLQEALKEGLSYPRAREKALIRYFQGTDTSSQPSLDTLKSPNNILGIEYLKALYRCSSSIHPFTIERKGANYHSPHLSSSLSSATAIRQALYTGSEGFKHALPSSNTPLLYKQALPQMEKLISFLHYELIFSDPEPLYSLWDIPKDLLHTLIKNAQDYPSYEQLVNRSTSKTYTRATVQRSLLRILAHIVTTTIAYDPYITAPYIRVLGCKKESTYLLKALTTHSKLPIITNPRRQYEMLSPLAQKWMDYEITASKLYAYTLGDFQLSHADFTHPFIIL